MKQVVQFGEIIEGFEFAVLNEREIRAAAGILFAPALTVFVNCQIASDFTPLKYMVTFFLIDMVTRVLNPRYAPSLILGRLMTRKQTPEYVAAKPKRFAWMIGLALATTVFILQVVMNAASPITGLSCLACLTFLFFEVSFGICLGCKLYPLIAREEPRLCPGEVCDPKQKHEIQKTSGSQVAALVAALLLMVTVGVSLHENYAARPYDLFGIFGEDFNSRGKAP